MSKHYAKNSISNCRTNTNNSFCGNKSIEEEKALAVGMAEKAKEFVDKGSEIYHGKPEGVDDHH